MEKKITELFSQKGQFDFDYTQWKHSWMEAGIENPNKERYRCEMEKIKKKVGKVNKELKNTLTFYEYALKFLDLTNTNQHTIERGELEHSIKIMRGSG